MYQLYIDYIMYIMYIVLVYRKYVSFNMKAKLQYIVSVIFSIST